MPKTRREREEQRPKNAGVHKDQLKRQVTKSSRRAVRRELRLERRGGESA